MAEMIRVRAYWNIHKGCYSIMNARTGRLIKDRPHREYLTILFPKFDVQAAGRRKVIETGRKNVHAFVTGELVPEDGPYSTYLMDGEALRLTEWLTYNPRTCKAFHTIQDHYKGREVFEAEKIYLDIKSERPRMRALGCVPSLDARS